MYRKVMSTHMPAGEGGKQKRMWAGHRKKRARTVEVAGWPGPIDKGSNPVQSLEPTGANVCNTVRPKACLNPLTHRTQNAMLMQFLWSAHGRG